MLSKLTSRWWYLLTPVVFALHVAEEARLRFLLVMPVGGDPHRGAVELLARYQENNIDKEAFTNFVDTAKANASKASTWGVGLRWYLSPVSNFAINYDRTSFTGGTGTLGLDGKTEQLLVGRYQVAF